MNITERYRFFDDSLVKTHKGVDWKNSIGLCFKIIYEWDLYEFKVEEYNVDTKYITLSLDGELRPPIFASNLKKCAIGKLTKKITDEFKVKIGQRFKDGDRNIEIIELYHGFRGNGKRVKKVKYKCNKCGSIEEMEETSILNGRGCPYCCNPPRKVKLGINTIWDTDRWMCDLGVSEEDAKKYIKGSRKKITVKCPDCGQEKEISIANMYNRKSISCSCGDGYSYPCKLMTSILNHLDINFIREYSPDYLIRYENGKKSRKFSDFYLPDYKLIIETDGGMNHRGGKVHGKSNKTIDYHIDVDIWKDEQHLKHGIKTIRINCFESNLTYIRTNLLSSELSNIFNLSKINWDECEKFAIRSNKIKDICNYWNNKEYWETTTNIAKIFDIDKTSVINYLKKGTKLGWCYYNPKEEKKKSGIKVGKLTKKDYLLHAERLNEWGEI